jgi:hypothetical protein
LNRSLAHILLAGKAKKNILPHDLLIKNYFYLCTRKNGAGAGKKLPDLQALKLDKC